MAADPAVRRVVENYDRARRSFDSIHATVRLLSATGMIPNELKALAPSPTAAFFAKPDQAWVEAIERLDSDADATLPE